MDESSFDILPSVYALQPNESGSSLSSLTVEGVKYVVCGTAIHEGEEEPSRGRILIFNIIENQLVLVAEKEVSGAVYDLADFSQGRLVAAVNSLVLLFSFSPSVEGATPAALRLVCSHSGNILALRVETRGDFILVGDLMKSVSLLLWNSAENKLEEVGRDYNPQWPTAISMQTESVFLAAEASFNLYTCARDADATTDEDRSRLLPTGEFHLGELVNTIRRGNLVLRLPDSEHLSLPTSLLGSVSGHVGVVASLNAEQYAYFSRLQSVLSSVVCGIGGLDHGQWRSFSTERTHKAARNFIDGDLIESVLELPPVILADVARKMETTPEELLHVVESITSALH